eukprot:g79559.t1
MFFVQGSDFAEKLKYLLQNAMGLVGAVAGGLWSLRSGAWSWMGGFCCRWCGVRGVLSGMFYWRLGPKKMQPLKHECGQVPVMYLYSFCIAKPKCRLSALSRFPWAFKLASGTPCLVVANPGISWSSPLSFVTTIPEPVQNSALEIGLIRNAVINLALRERVSIGTGLGGWGPRRSHILKCLHPVFQVYNPKGQFYNLRMWTAQR